MWLCGALSATLGAQVFKSLLHKLLCCSIQARGDVLLVHAGPVIAICAVISTTSACTHKLHNIKSLAHTYMAQSRGRYHDKAY
jgi:hypothetical protein